MSADNWRVCPQCKIRNAEKTAKKFSEVQDSYGKDSPDAYMEKLMKAKEFAAEPLEQTLREDYEIYIDEDGDFYAGYRGGCDRCGLVFNFKHEEKVPLEGDK